MASDSPTRGQVASGPSDEGGQCVQTEGDCSAAKKQRCAGLWSDGQPEYFNASTRTDALQFDVRTEAHPPWLYKAGPQPADYNCVSGGWSAVGEKELDGYSRLGYIVVEDALSPSDVEAVLTALRAVVRDQDFRREAEHVTARQKAGQVDLSLGGRNAVLQFESFARGLPDEELYTLGNVRKLMGFEAAHPRLTALASDSAMLDVIRRMLLRAGASAEDVAGLEVFQSLALLKPKGGREKPWHQDNAYFDVDGDVVKMAGVWIALSDVTQENGAMHVLPAALNELRPLPHFSRRDWQICDTDVQGKECVAIPCKPGSALFFSTLLPHGTPTNVTDTQRLAVQFHFAPRGAPRTDAAARLAVYGAEAQGVQC